MPNKASRKQPGQLSRYGILITYSELTGTWPALEDLKSRLRRLNRSEVIQRIAWCSASTRSWKIVRDSAADEQVRSYLFPFWSEEFRLWTERFGPGYLFSRYTLLWLMREAFLTCPPDGLSLGTEDGRRCFGEACLIANDLSAFLSPKRLPTNLAVAANLIPQTEFFSQEDYDRDISRTLCLLNEIAPNADTAVLRSVARTVELALGYGVTEYSDLVLASAMLPITAKVNAIADYQVMAVKPESFAQTSVVQGTAELFLSSIAEQEQVLSERLMAEGVHAADFTVLRDRPFLQVGDHFVPLDIGFILDKAGKSLFWTVLKKCPDPQRLLQHWGELFEHYVTRVLAEAKLPDSTFLPDPKFEDGAQVADGAIQEGSTLILLEYKASTIRNSIKYADNPDDLGKVLESRFVEGEGQGRKGLAQLANAVHRLSRGDAIVAPASGQGIPNGSISKIIPVLVHLDNTLRTPGIPHYMKSRFKSMVRSVRFTVTPLVLLPVTELEEIEGHLEEKPLSVFLESFLSILRADRTAVFLARTLPVLKGQPRKAGKTLALFDRHMEQMIGRLFPDHGTAAR